MGSDISLVLAVVFTSMFIYAGYLARQGDGMAHRRVIFGSMTAMFGYFIYYYKVRRLGYISFSDQLGMSGENSLRSALFKPVLLLHFTVVSLSTFASFYTVISGIRGAVSRGGKLILEKTRLPLSRPLWIAGLVWLGLLLWWVFYWWGGVHRGDLGLTYKLMFVMLGYAIPAAIALTIHKVFPFAEERHRFMGRLTVGLFITLLFTSIATYSLLYVF